MCGRLIAIEGLDGSGKTTLSQGLATALGAVWATTPGPHIRKVRQDFDLAFARSPVARCLAYGASVIAAGQEALETLQGGQDVVMDRYWLSTLAWADPAAARALAEMSAHVVPASLTIYLAIPEDLRRRRLLARGSLSPADRATLADGEAPRLDAAFRALHAHPVAGRFCVLAASGSPAQVLARALASLRGASELATQHPPATRAMQVGFDTGGSCFLAGAR